MDDDGTLENRLRRDGRAERGASQTHGADDPSGVDAEPDIPALRFGGDDDDSPAAPSDASPG